MKNLMISKKDEATKKKKDMPTDPCFKEKNRKSIFPGIKEYLPLILVTSWRTDYDSEQKKDGKKDTTTCIKHKSIISSLKM